MSTTENEPGHAVPPSAGLTWVKSSLSHANGNCAEVAFLDSGEVLVRNARNPRGAVLRFTPAEWDAFLGGVRNGEFDRSGGEAG